MIAPLTLALLSASTLGLDPAPPAAGVAPQRDRQAILAMAGAYRVTFRFRETVGIEPGYELHDPYHAEATEFIKVIEDRGDFISLQHVLVVRDDEGEPHVVKHWRQDWTYQDTELLEYRGNRTWEPRRVSPGEAAGAWSQAVYQVDDSPRYEALGRWTHVGGRSAWASAETWRPLPRREYTHRHDYDVLVARNRHTITPNGWVHEQDNYKVVLDDDGRPSRVLAHESGLNVYDRAADPSVAAGRAYWEATAGYWRDVRAAWADVLDRPRGVALRREVGGERLPRVILAMADGVAEAGRYDTRAMRPVIRERIAAFVTVPTGHDRRPHTEP